MAPEARRSSFGGAVAVGENVVFVGEPSSFRDPGAVHAYTRSGDGRWVISATLTAVDAFVGDGFGQVLATSGSTLVVGQPFADDRAGALYVLAQDRSTGVWNPSTRVGARTGAAAAGFGSSLAMDDTYVLAGAPGFGETAGTVYVYRVGADGSLTEETTLSAPSPAGDDRFGSSVALLGNTAIVGAPGVDAGAGAVFVFQREADEWMLAATLTIGSDESLRLGGKVAYNGARILASVPGADQGNGAVAVFNEDASGKWSLEGNLAPSSEGTRLRFGSAIAVSGDEFWIGVPGASASTGAVEVYREVDGELTFSHSIADDDINERDSFGGAVAVSRDVAIVAASGDAYGEGAAIIFERDDNGTWAKADLIYNAVPSLDPIAGSQVDCTDGSAAGYACANVDLISFIPLKDIETGRGVRLNDVWGWTDPQTGKEYAIVGTMEETVFLDLSDPQNPVYLGKLPMTEGSQGNTWRDMKTYANHAFIVADGAGPHGMQVFDLTQLRDVANPPVTFAEAAIYRGIHSAHNIVINEDSGFAYTVGNSSGGETCGGGLHMIDIRDPLNPTFAGCFADTNTGGGTGASHDAQCVSYHGPDSEHRDKEICIGSNGTAISVADVTDKANPVAISHRGYPTSAYVHQGWLTDDHRYFYQNDEADELSGKVDRTRTLVWDLADLDDPILVTEFFGPTNATDHNLYVVGDFMYETNNASGLRVVDISDRENPIEFGFFDTTPYGTDDAGFNGTWSSYPYFESGMVVVTSRREGVFIVKRRERDL
jgi:choice-of-anchor B domain-containing protein